MPLLRLLSLGVLQKVKVAMRRPAFPLPPPLHAIANFSTLPMSQNPVQFSDVITASESATRCYPIATQAGQSALRLGGVF